jgi:hypothetical protein
LSRNAIRRGCWLSPGVKDRSNPRLSFELTPRGRDVLLVLTHRRLGNRVEMVSVASGWHTLLGILVEHLNGCEPRWIWSVRAAVEDEYEKRIPPD